MKQKIKNIISNILMKFIDIDKLNLAIKMRLEQKMLNSVTIGKQSKIHHEATIHNLANDKTKIKIGEGTHIRGELLVYPYGSGISIGDNSYIGANSIIRAGDKIEIGNNVLIAHGVNIIDTDSHELDAIERAASFELMLKNGHPKSKGNVLTEPIFIKDYAWISYNVSILKGITIGEGSIVAAGSVVTKNVEAYTLVAGNPAKVIKEIRK